MIASRLMSVGVTCTLPWEDAHVTPKPWKLGVAAVLLPWRLGVASASAIPKKLGVAAVDGAWKLREATVGVLLSDRTAALCWLVGESSSRGMSMKVSSAQVLMGCC